MAIGLGTYLSIFTRILDCHDSNTRRMQYKPIRPEDKLVGLALGAPLLAIGLWWFGWTIPPKTPVADTLWIVPTLSLVLVGYALREMDTVLYEHNQCYRCGGIPPRHAIGGFSSL